jgi:outer membrane protein OmpA-like peptidoglycan-associated protein
LLATLAIAGPALAQNPPVRVDEGYSVERFRLATDAAGILDVESAEVGEPMAIELGLWLGYADDPLNLYREGEVERERIGSLVSHRLGGDLIGAVALGHRLQIAVDLPLILSQDEEPGDLMTAGPALSGFGLGDVRVVPKLQLLAPPRGRGVGLAVALGATLPTGTEDNYFGDEGGTLAPELIASARVDDRLRFGANLGYRARRKNSAFDLEINDEIYAHIGAGYRATPELELLATFSLATAAASPLASADEIFSELRGGASFRVGRGSLFAALGLGTTKGFGAPDWRVVSGVRFELGGRPVSRLAPEPQLLLTVKPQAPTGDADSDLDGRLDAVDQCPRFAEDLDGFEDDDGCPDHDNDRDLVADADDACPDEPGPAASRGCPIEDRDRDGVPDAVDNCPDEAGSAENRGCVKEQLVVLSETDIAVLRNVLFATNQARVQLRSYPVLRNVAEVLQAHPEIGRVRIEGHTDSQGSDASNVDLSRRRAETVREFLIAQGVASERLEAAGRGEEKPIGDNATAEGRAANRRVEFHLVSGD